MAQGDGFRPARPGGRKPLNPYVVTAVLFALGLWFLYDGFLNPEIRAVWFKRIGGLALLAAGVWDGLRQRRLQRARESLAQDAPAAPPGAGDR
jgi:hypothetical protein